MPYDPASIAAYFDEYGSAEWRRLVKTPADEVSLHVHEHYLRSYVTPGSRVLEIGAGPGRFTGILAALGCRVVVADISPMQLDLNRANAAEQGFADAVEEWVLADISELDMFGNASFDAVVAYGGPIGYALDRREQALRECRRVVRDGGMLLMSVGSLWGSVHAGLEYVLRHPAELSERIIATGDIDASSQPFSRHHCHLFRADELRAMIERNELDVVALSASGVLSAVHGVALETVRSTPERWSELLRMELEASAQSGCLDMGTHMIAVARRATGGT